MAAARTPRADAALREEHDQLARRLEVRASVDLALRALLRLAGGVLALGVAAALAWNRWGYRPEGSGPGPAAAAFNAAGAVIFGATAISLLALGAVRLRRSRLLAREEAALFARLRELRRALEIDP
jgi:hypothetical protein